MYGSLREGVTHTDTFGVKQEAVVHMLPSSRSPGSSGETCCPRYQGLMVINHGEERKQHRWGPALFLGDNFSGYFAGSCHEIGAKPRQEDRVSILASRQGNLQMNSKVSLDSGTNTSHTYTGVPRPAIRPL